MFNLYLQKHDRPRWWLVGNEAVTNLFPVTAAAAKRKRGEAARLKAVYKEEFLLSGIFQECNLF